MTHRLITALLFAPLVAITAQSPRALPVTRDVQITASTADLSPIRGVALSHTGDLLLGQRQDQLIRVFGANGPKPSIGRKGAGPGEFARITGMGITNDTLWVLDPSNDRISFFAGPTYTLARSIKMPFSMPSLNGVNPDIELNINAILPNGDFRAEASHSDAPKHLPAWYVSADTGSTIFVRTSPDGAFKQRLAVLPPSKCMVVFRMREGTGAVSIPFCQDQLSTAASGSDEVLYTVNEQRPGTAAAVHVTLVNSEGVTVFTRTLTPVPVAIPTATRDSASDAREKRSKMNPPEFQAAAPKPAIPATYEPVRAVMLGRDGTSWIDIRTKDSAHTWYLLDRKGVTIGTVTVPANVTLRAADKGFAWGTELDADGLEGVVRYSFKRQ